MRLSRDSLAKTCQHLIMVSIDLVGPVFTGLPGPIQFTGRGGLWPPSSD